MGNFCSRGESIRNIEIEIEELRNEIASLRLARGREVSEVEVQSGRTTASSSGGGGISDQTATTSKRGGRTPWRTRRSWGVQSD